MVDYKLKEVKTFTYERPEIRNGYTDQTLHVGIGDGSV